MAARFDQMVIGGLLLEAGVSTRNKSDTELTPFMIACAEGHQNFCILLLGKASTDGEVSEVSINICRIIGMSLNN